jgi:uncharacterized membrane-anchored protein
VRLGAREIAILGGLVLILGLVNWQIAAKERVLRDGERVLIELAPVDPRSLMQGDYMRLEYRISRDLSYQHPDWPADGRLVVTNDADGVAQFARLDQPGVPLGAAEHLLRYRRRDGRIRIGTDAFFFQEGQSDRFRDARYGELRVDASGESLLIGLRDKNRQPISAASTPGAALAP